MTYFAKSPRNDGTQETVRQHLAAVADLASRFGQAFDQGPQAGLCGQFHDFGKYSTAFQNVLTGTQTGIDHALCGAAVLHSLQKPALSPQVEAVAAHHTQLVSHADLKGLLDAVLQDKGPVFTPAGKQAALSGPTAYQQASEAFFADFPSFRFPPAALSLPPGLGAHPETAMLYTRMLFSCLVDADYTLSADQPPAEGPALDVETGLQNLYAYATRLRTGSRANSALNQARNALFDRCGEAGAQPGGLFTLTAPTGTGKTLALLHFALRHCQHTGKRRIFVVLPFLSLIEQSTATYRQILPQVLEDHSQANLPDELREHAARWDQPFIVTTSVRFFETLFADRPTDCRKLHNLANSVILFDEAQSLPLPLTGPTLRAVKELCTRYRCTMVFSTATQPHFAALPNADWQPRELLPDHPAYYARLGRTRIHWDLDAPRPLAEIAASLAADTNACAIVNLRTHARQLYQALAELCPASELFLLSTDLCPAHRTQVIQTIRDRQRQGLPCRVVATQCIEAGVDLDFDRLYRALAPLEAIIQAAGRCNRNGNHPNALVRVFVPQTEGPLYPDASYANAASLVMALHQEGPLDIHNPQDIRRYYTQLFGQYRGDAVSQALQAALTARDYPAVAQTYRLIQQRGQQVIVPYPEQLAAYQTLRQKALQTGLTRQLLHAAAPLTVTTFDQGLLDHCCEPLFYAPGRHGQRLKSTYHLLLTGQESCYDPKKGLCSPAQEGNFGYFC